MQQPKVVEAEKEETLQAKVSANHNPLTKMHNVFLVETLPILVIMSVTNIRQIQEITQQHKVVEAEKAATQQAKGSANHQPLPKTHNVSQAATYRTPAITQAHKRNQTVVIMQQAKAAEAEKAETLQAKVSANHNPLTKMHNV